MNGTEPVVENTVAEGPYLEIDILGGKEMFVFLYVPRSAHTVISKKV